MDITGKKVSIVGGQRSGMALARMVVRRKGRAGISEQGPEGSLSREFMGWASDHGVAVEYGGHTRGFIQDSDFVVLSPGVRFDAPPVLWAQAANIPVLGEIEFAAQFCPKPVVAVTGSNGKTTVSTLITRVIRKAGCRACLCGNVGAPFSDFVLDLEETDYVVLEISSFQLESVLDPSSPFRTALPGGAGSIRGFKPHVAVILNFSQNHLDRHKDLDEYFDAKKKIFLNQGPEDFLVLNYQDPRLRPLPAETKSRAVFFNAPSDRADDIVNPNFRAVARVARALGIDERCYREVFKEFGGVEHRLEKVRELNGVDFVNDSKATTAQAALWALESIHKPVVMICGGRDKNIDFSVLAGPVKRKVKRMFVIGEARPKIRAAFDALTGLEECAGLEEAVVKAKQSAVAGDCVLLSPMCASFDMFKDYEERGRVFKEIVSRLL
jgi:UDP-N-acetylmuramoylalanine--D-glutamate ligase